MIDRGWLAEIEPRSELGQLIKNHRFIEDDSQRWAHERRLIQLAIQAEIAPLVLRRSQMIAFITLEPVEFGPIIQSQDRRYVWQVVELATQVLACGFGDGLSCAPESGFMGSTCAKNTAACGLDFLTWYRQNTLPGLQQDVELMVEYLLEMSQ